MDQFCSEFSIMRLSQAALIAKKKWLNIYNSVSPVCYFTTYMQNTSPYAISGSPQNLWNNLLSRASIPVGIAWTVEINAILERTNALMSVTSPKIKRCLDFQSSRRCVISAIFFYQLLLSHSSLSIPRYMPKHFTIWFDIWYCWTLEGSCIWGDWTWVIIKGQIQGNSWT